MPMKRSDNEGKRRTAKAQAPKPAQLGWLSTDEIEIERRRLRAELEPLHIEDVQTEGGYYGDYRRTHMRMGGSSRRSLRLVMRGEVRRQIGWQRIRREEAGRTGRRIGNQSLL